MCELKPDIEVLFIFNNKRKYFYNNYRPAHLILNDYFTTGLHQYYDVNGINLKNKGLGTIIFLSPEVYPHSLWFEKKICIYEGSNYVGYALVTKIYNRLLKKLNDDDLYKMLTEDIIEKSDFLQYDENFIQYLRKNIMIKNMVEIKRMFDFIEISLKNKKYGSKKLTSLRALESVMYIVYQDNDIKSLLGIVSKKVIENLKKYDEIGEF